MVGSNRASAFAESAVPDSEMARAEAVPSALAASVRADSSVPPAAEASEPRELEA